ncbi:hypothetical protein CTI12_AA436150 [Artemisia annua]|uniref:Uncharacterized protein n=1 Tax=Artemisia annua TaxID=35608 RepID=A0A2U1LUW9_ARTAN|nr:hypothetical protein CTI12_AA436150 [Artemisia annua]
MEDYMYDDCESLLEQAKLDDKLLSHNRRWLIGLPTSAHGSSSSSSKFPTQKPVPEYLLREDDVSCETIKSFVEKGVKACNTKTKYHIDQDEMHLIYSPRNVRGLLSLVDNMTNEGLFQFAEVLTGGSIKFEKTRWKMKQIIKECLSKVFPKKKNIQRINLSEYHSSILKNPHNYRWSSQSRFIPDSDSYHTAVHKILNVLEDLPTLALSAMHRKLKGDKDYTPQLISKKTGWNRDRLIKRLRTKCLEFLSDLNEGDSLQEPLAKAMEVASLTLKLIQGCQYVIHFIQFLHEMKVLQNEIAMCIQLLDQRVELSVLKDIQVLLNPEAKLNDRTLRMSIRNLLTEYLLECSHIDDVPKCVLKVLAVIKKSCEPPYKHLTEMKIEEDVECILNVSASTKQVMWDLIPEHEHELDLEFADAYMEDLEDSDDGDFREDTELEENNISRFGNSDDQEGSTGDNFNPDVTSLTNSGSLNRSDVANSQRTHSMGYHLVSLRNTEQQMEIDSLNDSNKQDGVPPSDPLENLESDDQNMCKNQYLDVQTASDEASKVAYRLIGLMLNDFAQIEGCELSSGDRSYLGVGTCDLNPKKHKAARKKRAASNGDGCPVFIKAVEELLPSFIESEAADKLKELMGFLQ